MGANESTGAMPIRVVLVEDHAMIRQMLELAFTCERGFAVVGRAGTAAEARRLSVRFDVAIVDIQLPDGSGLDLIRPLRTACPAGAVLVLTASTERTDVARAMEAGAAGVVHKSAGLGEIIRAVRRLAAGELLLSPREAIELMRLWSRIHQEEREAERKLSRLTPSTSPVGS